MGQGGGRDQGGGMGQEEQGSGRGHGSGRGQGSGRGMGQEGAGGRGQGATYYGRSRSTQGGRAGQTTKCANPLCKQRRPLPGQTPHC